MHAKLGRGTKETGELVSKAENKFRKKHWGGQFGVETKKFNSVENVYLYTSEGNLKDVKYFHQMKIKNLTLLNPLSILKTGEDEKFHEYNTLALAETGNAFGGIDV